MKSADADNPHPTNGEMRREVLHYRTIEMQGSSRADGLFEVEGRVLDRKTTTFGPNLSGRLLQPMEPLHSMGVRIVFDDQMGVMEISSFTDAAPHPSCDAGGAALQSLVGLRMTAGWGKEVRDRLPSANCCTHLKELLMPLATVAFQTLSELRLARRGDPADWGLDRVDTCHAMAASGDIVRRYWPELHRPNA
jgi:hypothetical protein